MKKPPSLQTQPGSHVALVSGKRLNELLAAAKQRTPLPPLSPAQTSTCPALPGAFIPGKLYFVSPAFSRRLTSALAARAPRSAASAASNGFFPGTGAAPAPPAKFSASPPDLAATTKMLRASTPLRCRERSASGWRTGPTSQRLGAFRIEVERRTMRAQICAPVSPYSESYMSYILVSTAVEHFENGSVTTTDTFEGRIQTYQDVSELEECLAPVHTTNFDPEFDYGDFLDVDLDDEFYSFEDLRSAAIAAISDADVISSSVVNAWGEHQWREVSADLDLAGSPFFAYFPELLDLGAETIADEWSAVARDARWRVVNLGQCIVRLDWERRKTLDDTLITSGSVTIPRNQTSDWSARPTLSANPDNRFKILFTRVRMGPHLSAP